MKTITVTICVFLALCVLMVANYNYIHKKTAELTSLVLSLDYEDPEDCRKTLDKTRQLFDEASRIFSLTVSFREIDYLSESLISLSSSLESRNESDFVRFKALLVDAIDGIARLERLSS